MGRLRITPTWPPLGAGRGDQHGLAVLEVAERGVGDEDDRFVLRLRAGQPGDHQQRCEQNEFHGNDYTRR